MACRVQALSILSVAAVFSVIPCIACVSSGVGIPLVHLCPWVCFVCVVLQCCARRWHVAPSVLLCACVPHNTLLFRSVSGLVICSAAALLGSCGVYLVSGRVGGLLVPFSAVALFGYIPCCACVSVCVRAGAKLLVAWRPGARCPCVCHVAIAEKKQRWSKGAETHPALRPLCCPYTR